MTEQITFTVRSNPVPKQSFRYNPKGKNYQPERVVAWQKLVQDTAWAHLIGKPKPLFSMPVSVEMYFWRGDRRKVDLDNLNKSCLDALKGVVIEDDDQVIELWLRKGYDTENPRVEITVTLAEDDIVSSVDIQGRAR